MLLVFPCPQDSNLEEDSKKLEDRNHHYLPLQVQDHPPPPQEIGRLFRSDTSTTNFSENLSLELISSDLDDPILNVHLEEVHTGVPTIVHPNERPSIVTAQTNVAEIVLSPSMIVSPEYPQAPPPSPYDNTFGDPVHEHIDDFENEVRCSCCKSEVMTYMTFRMAVNYTAMVRSQQGCTTPIIETTWVSISRKTN